MNRDEIWQAPLQNLQTIADAVLKLSDFYIQSLDKETPWTETYCQLAYRHYYLPLNFIRVEKVLSRGLQVNFFKDLETFVDWGCGPATASLAFAVNSELKRQIKKQILFDRTDVVFKVFNNLHSNLIDIEKLTKLHLPLQKNTKNSCLIFSYSLTEINDLPIGFNQYEALVILEPSTQQDGRKLLELRQKLIEAGYFIWAPCTHQLSCPLLLNSKHDWCHDRVKVEAPDWFRELEALLPMKNKTVTTSYLLARKTPPPESLKNLARLTGDSLEEKGKTRQLVCRGENREFLTWMHKKISPQTLQRGDLVKLPENLEQKSNELRLDLLIKSPPDNLS